MGHLKERAFHFVTEEHSGLRLDRCISQVFDGLSRRQARHFITGGKIWVNGRPIRILSRKVFTGDRVTWFASEEPESSETSASDGAETVPGERSRRHHQVIDWDAYGGKPEFLFRDKYLAVLNKTSGIPTEPTPREDIRICLRQVEAIQREEGLHPRRVYAAAVHRLDAQASGALAFAMRKKAAAELCAQFASRSASRIYQALVVGRVEEDEGEIRHHLGRIGPGLRQGVVSEDRGKHAITQYKVLERFADSTWVELKLQTGRTHQIRVQMSAIGHPLLGDWLYLPKQDAARCPVAGRLMLHAIRLSLTHPKTQEPLTFEAPLPDDFSSYLETLRSTSKEKGA